VYVIELNELHVVTIGIINIPILTHSNSVLLRFELTVFLLLIDVQLGWWRCFLTCHRGGGAGGEYRRCQG